MRTILIIVRKEFLQVFRNRTMLPIIFIMPLVQLIILVNAATLEMKNINMYVVDKDMSVTSRQLISKFEGSPFFHIVQQSFSIDDAKSSMLKGKSGIILNIPSGFEKKLYTENKSDIQLLIDAVNGMVAGLTNAYTAGVINDFNAGIRKAVGTNATVEFKPQTIDISYSYWYNPELNFKFYMVPGILVILVSIVGMFLTALNLVREKEIGTIEQINVTPIVKYQFIIGKLVPFWVIALFELAFGLFLGKLLFSVPIVGSIWLLFLFAGVYLFTILGLGLLISTLANSQQQVMFLTFFFMIVFILMSGIFTPIESMPQWAQKIDVINPFAYFMRVNRMILLKGSGFKDILHDLISITIYGILMLSLATWRYRKVA